MIRNKETEPIKESLPICGKVGCDKPVDVSNPDVGYIRYMDQPYHPECFTQEAIKASESILWDSKTKERITKINEKG